MKNMKYYLLCITILLLASCNTVQQDHTSTFPGIAVPIENFNTIIQLEDSPQLLNTHKNGGDLDILVNNLSDEAVIFPENYGLKLFTNENNKWVEVPNNSYNAGVSFRLPPQKEYPLGALVSVLPYIAGLETPVTIRVIVIGHQEKSNLQVGAYLDIKIDP
jgi:hypothetical protein